MATIRERGPAQWQAIVETKNRATGLVHKEAKTFPTKTEAMTWAQALEADLRRGQHNDTRLLDATALHEMIERYIKEVSPKKLGSKQEITRLRAWQAHPLAQRPLSRCLPKDFADYITERRKTPSARNKKDMPKDELRMVSEQTIKHEIIAISNVFESARKDWGYPIPNPTKQISKPGSSQSREARIPPDLWPKVAAELKKCRNKQYVLIAEFAIETGMREDEIMRMAWQDIDRKQRIVEVEGKDTSRTGQRKRRIVPLSACALEILAELPQHIDARQLVFQTARKTSADGLSRAFTKACRDAGIEGTVFHSTRHEAASRMAARYYHASIEDLHAGLNRMRAV